MEPLAREEQTVTQRQRHSRRSILGGATVAAAGVAGATSMLSRALPVGAQTSNAPPLEQALQHLLNSPLGDLAVMVRNRGIQLVFTQVQSTGRWNSTDNRIEVSSRFQNATADALAAVLAHETTHAQDFFRGLPFTSPEDCTNRSMHAFNNQALFWRTAHGAEGKRSNLDELAIQNNLILRLMTEQPAQALPRVSEVYGETCAPPASVGPVSPPTSLIRLDVPSNDLVYDPFRGRIYASIPGSVGATGNSIAVIDPSASTITHTIHVGSEPNQLAISDDGHFLYVGLDGTAAIRRVALTAGPADQYGMADLQFPLLANAVTAEEIAVQPGSPHTIAVSRARTNVSPRHGGVVIFDDGEPRPNKTPEHTGPDRIEFGFDPSELYGYNNGTTSHSFYRLAVDENGVSVRDATGGLIYGFYHDLIFDNGLLYASTGAVVDPVSLQVVGTYPGVLPTRHRAIYGVPYPNDVAMVRPDSSVGRVFFLTGNLSDRRATSYRLYPTPPTPPPPPQPVSMQILVFDQNTFTQIGALDVPGMLGRATSLIRWGADGLAFRTGGGQTVLLRSTLVSGALTNAI